MEPDVISFVIGWPAFGEIRNRSIGRLASAMKMAGNVESLRKKTDRKKAQRLANE